MCLSKVKYLPLLFAFALANYAAYGQNTRIRESEIQLQDKYLEAVGQQQIGKPEAASKLFLEVLEKNPKCDACAFQLARLNETMGKHDLAQESIKKAIAIEPKNKWYRMFLADLYEKGGKDKDAAEIYKSLASPDAFDEDIYYHWAFSLLRSGEPDKALKVYDDIEKRIGLDEDLTHKKHDVYMALGETKKAGNELKKLSAAFPQNLDYLHLLADFYEKNGQHTEASGVYKSILKLDPNDSKANMDIATGSKKPTAESELTYLMSLKDLFGKPDIHIDLKIKELLPYINKVADKHDTALGDVCLDLAKTIQKAHPTEAKAYSMLGDLYYHTGKPMEALEQYKQCVKITKVVYTVWEQMLFIYDENGMYDDLLTTSEQVLDLFPNNPVPYFFNGLANEKKGKINEAITSLSQASLMSVRKPTLKLETLVEMGVAYTKGKDFDKADKAFDEALKFNPSSSYALAKKGYSLSLRVGQSLQAKAIGEQALKNGGDKIAAVLETYGDVLYKCGDPSGAVVYWQKAKENGAKSKGLERKILEKAILE